MSSANSSQEQDCTFKAEMQGASVLVDTLKGISTDKKNQFISVVIDLTTGLRFVSVDTADMVQSSCWIKEQLFTTWTMENAEHLM